MRRHFANFPSVSRFLVSRIDFLPLKCICSEKLPFVTLLLFNGQLYLQCWLAIEPVVIIQQTKYWSWNCQIPLLYPLIAVDAISLGRFKLLGMYFNSSALTSHWVFFVSFRSLYETLFKLYAICRETTMYRSQQNISIYNPALVLTLNFVFLYLKVIFILSISEPAPSLSDSFLNHTALVARLLTLGSHLNGIISLLVLNFTYISLRLPQFKLR